MSSNVTFSCIINTSNPAANLGLEIWIDDNKLFDSEHITKKEQITLELSDDDGEHELRMILKNKEEKHTIIDADGNIVDDARLTITDIAFDEINLGHMLTELAVYKHNFNSTKELIEEKFYSEMGCNGTVSLKFATPIYLWLLEHM